MVENSRSDDFERVKHGLDHFLEEVKAYKSEMEKLEKTLQEKEVAVKAMKRSVLYLEGQ